MDHSTARVGTLLVLLLTQVTCAAQSQAWKPHERGLLLSAGGTDLGDGASVRCTVERGDRFPILTLFAKPTTCRPLSPIKIEVEMKASSSRPFDLHYHTPYDVPANVRWEDSQGARLDLPLMAYPPEGTSVWTRVVANCDDGKTTVEAAALCACAR